MTRFPLTRAALTGAALVALGAAPSFAQGTDAEREACTPDAIKLCSDTIPDIPKTTACMKAHVAQLSPRCRAVVASRGGDAERERSPGATRRERIGRQAPPRDFNESPRYGGERSYDDQPRYEEGRRYEEQGYDGEPGYEAGPAYAEPGERRYLYRDPNGGAAEAPAGRDRERARAEIERLCDEQMIDPRTCALTDRALR